jgi:asparagine synthase (glutamine-hydrolysing)
MGDFLLDFRPPAQRQARQLAHKLQFLPHIDLLVHRATHFDLAISYPDKSEIWRPFRRESGECFVAVAGLVALDEADWQATLAIPGEGGTVCRALARLYATKGLPGLGNLSGNFVIFIHDNKAGIVHLVTDCTGVFPAFQVRNQRFPIFGSHPDVLAEVAGVANNLDETSLAEFAITGSVSPPFTYYKQIEHLGRARFLSIPLPVDDSPVATRGYLPLTFEARTGETEEDVAEELAAAFSDAVKRRSRPAYGRCAVALSGGLDSRAVLASVSSPKNTFAFNCFDQENFESRAAREIASAAGVGFCPVPRSFDYYGDNAELGMRVSGGMGTFANNHFLGVLPWLREQGAGPLLTGCYCDYLFKALPLNRHSHPLTGKERLAAYNPEFYFNHFWPKTASADAVRARLDLRFPADLVSDTSDRAVFELEQRRTFPLCYEPDNAQRLIPQRLANWFVPISDPALLKLYCRIPYRWKLNRSIFRKAVARICSRKLNDVPDANTGAPVHASVFRQNLTSAVQRVRRRLKKVHPSLATQGSWPDWHYYIANSSRIASLWSSASPAADELFPRLVGRKLSPDTKSYQGNDIWLLVQLLSLKLWLQQR